MKAETLATHTAEGCGAVHRRLAKTRVKGVAGGLGFEPRFSESESDVLPLDDPPTQNGPHGPLDQHCARSLALRELRLPARLAQTDLLALDLARIARYVS